MSMERINILGVARKNPFDPNTSSGSSSHLFTALKTQGYLYDAISARPPQFIEALHKGLNFHHNIDKWRFKYDISVDLRTQRTRVARQKMESLEDEKFNVILQIGAWCDLTKRRNKITVSYQDGNLCTLLNSPYRYPRIGTRYLTRAFQYEQRIYQQLDYIFPRSQWLADSFVRDFGVSPRQITPPVGAGINLPYIKDVHDKSYEAPHVLFVGKEFERKGGKQLLEAFQLVRKEVKSARLTIIGTELASVPEGVKCLGRISKATPEGLERLLEAYASASIFVMPSLYEPYGIVFGEAMAHKLPCIGTNICAMPEIIDNGVNGFVVPPNDPQSLAGKIIDLLKDPHLCRQMGEQAYQKYLRNYTWDIVAGKIVAHLESVGSSVEQEETYASH